MIKFFCHNCGRPYPTDGLPFVCLTCGGYFDFQFDQSGVDEPLSDFTSLDTLIRKIENPKTVELISAGEGNTSLVEEVIFQRKVYLKLEFTNPTGSYKDRGSAVLVSILKSRGVTFAVEDSSGNAGASFAAYAARAGITSRIYIPEMAGGPKKRQIEAYGGSIAIVPGSRENAAEAAREDARKGIVYGSHAYLPHVLVGYSSIAFELIQQLGTTPGCVVAPVGQGNLIYAIGRAFKFMMQAGFIEHVPALIGVQAMACAPLWAVSKYGTAGLSLVSEEDTYAEGVKIKHPVRGDVVLNLVNASGGAFLAVEEAEIMQGRDQLAHRGFYVEPTSALIWGALGQICEDLPGPIVAILTGSGLKVDF